MLTLRYNADMADLLKLCAVFALIVVLMRRRLKVGYVMLGGAGGLALLYLMRPVEIIRTVVAALTDKITVSLLVALLLIRVLEALLRENDILARMTTASAALLRSRRASVVSMPLLIGMLPSVGGAYFSAPMVEESAREFGLPPEEKAFINYWFRHPWEYVLPLYPGVLLAAAMAGLPLRSLIARGAPVAVLMAALGFALSMRGLPPADPSRARPRLTAASLASFLPVAGVLALVMAAGAPLSLALCLVIAALYASYRYRPRAIWRSLCGGFSWDVVVLIGGVMVFKETMEVSGAVTGLSAWFGSRGIALGWILFTLPFLTGLLTGITVGFVGASFPLLLSLPGGSEAPAVAFAFAAGFAGVLLSPVHVCLVLTREYFGAGWDVYRRLLPATLALVALAFALYLAFAP
jgi:hypothetical protein